MASNRNILFLIIGALIVGMGVLSYNLKRVINILGVPVLLERLESSQA